METTQEVKKILNVGGEELGITIWDSRSITQARRTPVGVGISNLIDSLGVRSAKAQGLPRVISSASLLAGSDHKLYIVGSGGLVYGLLKIGLKKLFIRGKYAEFHEISPMCVLDFYVSETHQRTGVGYCLFERMLNDVDVPPRRLGYDRPSPKLLSFLSKHYQLTDFVAQNNNYVIYDQYWNSESDSNTPPPPAPTPPPATRMETAATPPVNNYNIINMQGGGLEAPVGLHTPVQRTGKRLVRPPYA